MMVPDYTLIAEIMLYAEGPVPMTMVEGQTIGKTIGKLKMKVYSSGNDCYIAIEKMDQ